MESNHHSAGRPGYSRLSSPVLSAREGGVAGRARTDAARITTANAAATPRPPRNGDDRIRTGGLSPDKRALCALELRPHGRAIAPAGVEPASRAHEARGTAVSPRRIWLAGVEPALSGSRNRRDVRLPYSQSKHPRRDSNPRFRAENPASLPLDHGGVDRRPWSRTRPCSISASRAATDTDLRKLRRQESNLRVAINSRAPCRSATPD